MVNRFNEQLDNLLSKVNIECVTDIASAVIATGMAALNFESRDTVNMMGYIPAYL